ncbi:MAG: HEPN domain-containing protein [Thermoanaerobaculia bacterium]
MTNANLAQSYLIKARARLKALAVLLAEKAFSDVVREAQEIVELALKGMLREVGIEPPKWHDVGGFLLEHAARFPLEPSTLERLAEISARLRKEREFAFYGEIDLIPTEAYTDEDGRRAFFEAGEAVDAANRVIAGGSPGSGGREGEASGAGATGVAGTAIGAGGEEE